MHQVSFPVKSGCINIFLMDYNDRNGRVEPCLIFIAGDWIPCSLQEMEKLCNEERSTLPY